MKNEYVQCSDDECNWIGQESDMPLVPSSDPNSVAKNRICPECSNPEHYLLTKEEFEKLSLISAG